MEYLRGVQVHSLEHVGRGHGAVALEPVPHAGEDPGADSMNRFRPKVTKVTKVTKVIQKLQNQLW
jgi:hypothetical protein